MASVSTAVVSKLPPKPVITWEKAQRIWRNWDVWRDPQSVVHRLPEHYKKRYWANVLSDRTPVHYEPPRERYTWDADRNLRLENEHYPVLVVYPAESDFGLWGGEGVVKGYEIVRKKKRRPFDRVKPIRWHARFFWPRLLDRVFYCEIFDKYLKIRTTRRTAELVDEHMGFDNYILRTPQIDLNSKLGNKLKREMLLSLARKDYYPDDPEKRAEIAEKYAEFVIPEEEAEWVGLDLNEAAFKLQDIEASRPPEPLKVKLEREMLARLQSSEISNQTGSFVKNIWRKYVK